MPQEIALRQVRIAVPSMPLMAPFLAFAHGVDARCGRVVAADRGQRGPVVAVEGNHELARIVEVMAARR